MMLEMLSKEGVDARLAEIAQQMMEQRNDRDHHLGRGHGGLMVGADRKLQRLKGEWDKTLLLHEVTCGRDHCKKTKPISRWRFFCRRDQERLIETSRVQCPCCGSVVTLTEHAMSARILWIVDHAYTLPEDLLHITSDINMLHSKTSIPR